MRFDSELLVRVIPLSLDEWICLCPSLSLKTFGQTRAESVGTMTVRLEDYVHTLCLLYTSPSPRDRG